MFLRHNFKVFTVILYFLLIPINGLVEMQKGIEMQKGVPMQTLQDYCNSFRSCHDCKTTAFQCEWCHDVGCTNLPNVQCPKKMLLHEFWKKHYTSRQCTEIVNKLPIFVPANIRRFIKLELYVDDMTLYDRNVICEIRIEQKVIQVTASVDDNVAYCDTVILKTTRNVILGHLRLIWGGKEPYSNPILLLVYNCKALASNCKDCLALNSEYNCGWCRETSSCSLVEECPRQLAPWINKSSSCGTISFQSYKYNREIKSYF